MNMRDVIFIYAVKKLPKEFEAWRTDLIKSVDKECKKLQIDIENLPEFPSKRYNAMVNFPKTIVRLTRQMCACVEYCVEYSLYYTEFDKSCLIYDLDKLMTDDRYFESNLIDMKVIYNRLEPKDYIVNEFALNSDMYNSIVNLCNNEKDSFIDLKCKAYELTDFCDDNVTCYEGLLDFSSGLPYFDKKLSHDDCKNTNYRNDLNAIHDKIYVSPLYRQERSKREIKYDNTEDLRTDNVLQVFLYLPFILLLVFGTVKFMKKKRYKTAFGLISLCGIVFLHFFFKNKIF